MVIQNDMDDVILPRLNFHDFASVEELFLSTDDQGDASIRWLRVSRLLVQELSRREDKGNRRILLV
jgi:hypothetical protein